MVPVLDSASGLEALVVIHEKTITELERTISVTEQKVTNLEKEMILVKDALGQLLKMGFEGDNLKEETHSSTKITSPTNINTEQRRDLPQKLKLPMYEGQNAGNWLFQVEMCFAVNKTPEEEKLDSAMACMEGRAVPWARIIQDREELKNWKDFKEKLQKRFNLTGGSTAIRQVLRLKQTGSVTEYRQRFEELSAEIPNVPNDILVELFLNGLRESLREQLVRYLPSGMDEIVDMAMMIEEQEAEENE